VSKNPGRKHGTLYPRPLLLTVQIRHP